MGERDRRRRREGGQSTVELALVLPVVAVVALALVDIGLVLRDNVLCVHAAREAARALAVGEDPVAAARSRSGLGTALAVNVDAATGTVSVELPLAGRLSILSRLAGGANLRQRATMRIEADAARPP
jgi:Flp pilus assembly protein TadG